MSIIRKRMTQNVYLKSKYEPDVMVRTFQNLAWIKTRGNQEFQEMVPTNIVTDFLIEGFEATKEEYDNFSKTHKAVKRSPKSPPKKPMEELCKEYGIPYEDTTTKHIGEVQIIFKPKPSNKKR